MESNSEKVLLANLTDMAYALKLVKPILFTTLYALPKKAFEILDVFSNSDMLEYRIKDVASKVDLSQNRTRTIIHGLVDRAFLYKDDSRKPYKYSWTGKKLEEPTILTTVNLKDFFTREEFEFWFDSNMCTYSEASRDVYTTFILPNTSLAVEQVHTSENNPETPFKTENEPPRFTIDETVHPSESLKEKIKSVVALPDTHVDRCSHCEKIEVLYWQIETFKGEWGHMCNNCGGLFQDILKKREN